MGLERAMSGLCAIRGTDRSSPAVPTAGVKDREDDDIKDACSRVQLFLVDARDLISRVAEGAAAKSAEDSVTHARVDERVQLCPYAPPCLLRIERAAVPQVYGRSAQLEEREDVVIRQPGIPEVGRSAGGRGAI